MALWHRTDGVVSVKKKDCLSVILNILLSSATMQTLSDRLRAVSLLFLERDALPYALEASSAGKST